jgi:ribosomal protein S18 acetylase RimI-like enzyme
VKVEEQPAGFLQVNLKNKIYWLEHIVVDQKYRGRGLSKLLMHSFFQQGIAKDCRSFQLWVINENHAAVNLYLKYGFQYMNKSTISLLKSNHA